MPSDGSANVAAESWRVLSGGRIEVHGAAASERGLSGFSRPGSAVL